MAGGELLQLKLYALSGHDDVTQVDDFPLLFPAGRSDHSGY